MSCVSLPLLPPRGELSHDYLAFQNRDMDIGTIYTPYSGLSSPAVIGIHMRVCFYVILSQIQIYFYSVMQCIHVH